MMWENCTLIGRVQNGTDKLNNPICEKKKICNFQGRLTQWNVEEVSALGRDYTVSHRKLLIRLPIDVVKGELSRNSIEVDGEKYNIDKLIDLEPRYWLLYITAYKL